MASAAGPPRQSAAPIPVEINALWYNALKIMGHLATEFAEETDYDTKAERVHHAFNQQFWNEKSGCLYDLVTPQGPDPAIRPNQLFALSLPFPLIEGERARRMIAVVAEHLLTPRGLRSLSPQDPAYRSHYHGDPWCREHGDEVRQRGRANIEGFADHLQEAGLGSVSEIIDAEPPFAPRGCVAQPGAWPSYCARASKICSGKARNKTTMSTISGLKYG